MKLVSTLKYITSHPLNREIKMKAVLRFLKWQISSRLMPYPIFYDFTKRAKLIVKKGMAGATGNLYCGLHEFNDMGFLLHFLRKEDLFVDIGANIGSYSVLSAAHVGATTISIEPVPSTYKHLVNNVLINNSQQNSTLLNIALGAKAGSIKFTTTLDTMNHVATDSDIDFVLVNVEVLDNVLSEHQAPALLKIDVEGFETEVINGASITLSKVELKAIIIELNGSGSRYGFDENKIREVLNAAGFVSYLYNPLTRTLKASLANGVHNAIYIRDIDFVKHRIITAEKINILNTVF